MSTMSFNFKVGDDNGNSEHDIYINGEVIKQPNVFAKMRILPTNLEEINPEFIIKNIASNLLITIDSPSCKPGIYFIGQYALTSGNPISNIEVGVDNNKLDSDIVIVNTVGQIAGYAVQKAYEKLKGKIEDTDIICNVDMTTALPIKQYSREKALQFANKFTCGKHKVTVHVSTQRINVEVKFKFVKVIPEGVTAVHALQNITEAEKDIFEDFNKKYKKQISDGSYFKNKKILHIAIGEGTTEYPVTDDIKFNPNFIYGSNNGVGHAIDNALPEFMDSNGLLNYTRQNYSEVLRNEEHKYHDSAKEIIAGYLDNQAEEILHNAKNQVQRANNDIDIIAVYGGGSIPMKNTLYDKLDAMCEKSKIELFYVPEKYAVILEALGMYYFTKGDIFTKLKQMSEASATK